MNQRAPSQSGQWPTARITSTIIEAQPVKHTAQNHAAKLLRDLLDALNTVEQDSSEKAKQVLALARSRADICAIANGYFPKVGGK